MGTNLIHFKLNLILGNTYFIGEINTLCTPETMIKDDNDCNDAHKALLGDHIERYSFNTGNNKETADWPAGCYMEWTEPTGDTYKERPYQSGIWNNHDTGSKNEKAKPICKRMGKLQCGKKVVIDFSILLKCFSTINVQLLL